MKKNINIISMLVAMATLLAAISCQGPTADKPLPILGHKGVENGDTVYHAIPTFAFINQDSQLVTNKTFADQIYVADFFFTKCPTICPVVKKQMLRIYDQFGDEPLALLSHSIDTRNDSVPALKSYAKKLNIEAPKWHLVTGKRDDIYEIADDYFSIATEDPDAPGGFNHSGRLILVDQNRHIRSFCDGTDPESVDRFMKDIEKLLKEPQSNK